MSGKLYRHGDVLIQEVEALPEHARQLTDSAPVLAYGEVTGHSHPIEAPEAVEMWVVATGLGADRFVRVLEPTRIVHEEHQPIPLEPGVYRFWQQREYVAPSERIRFRGGVSFRTVSD
jgi:hypothetical protein